MATRRRAPKRKGAAPKKRARRSVVEVPEVEAPDEMDEPEADLEDDEVPPTLDVQGVEMDGESVEGGEDGESRAIARVGSQFIRSVAEPGDPSEMVVGSIYRFLESVCLDPNGLGGETGGLILRFRDVTGKPGDQIMDMPIDPKVDAEDLEMLARRIAGQAHQEAEGLGEGTWGFVLYASRGGKGAPFARRSFTVYVQPGSGLGGDLGPAEDATPRSLLAQTQRHQEATMRLSLQMMNSTVQAMHTLNHQMGARLEYMEKNQADALRLLRDNIEAKEDRALAREIVIEEKQRSREIVGKLFEHVAPLVMGLVAQYCAKNGLIPGEPVPEAPKSGANGAVQTAPG